MTFPDHRTAVCATLILAVLMLGGSCQTAPRQTPGEPTARRAVFGRLPDGREVHLYRLANPGGIRATVMTWGATLTGVHAPDRDGNLDNVTLYLDTLEDYLKGHPLFGSVVGRYANRIAGAAFPLDGKTVEVEANAGKNHIHGGRKNFSRVLWQARPIRRTGMAGVELTHTSPDGHAGFPGTLAVTVRYLVTRQDELVMEYEATTDKPTVVNLTNHAYWNLAGAGSGNVLAHRLMLNADQYLPFGEGKIPTGVHAPVAGTPLDFREPKTVGSRIEQVEGENYDHCYVLNKKGDPRMGQRMGLAARVVDPASGRVMEVRTTQPGVQLYTAKGLGPRLKGGGKPYGPYHGLCLETQHYPDAPNRPAFPSTVLRPGETYRETTIHRFSVEAK
ncbi:MAG: aldose epimerase family protein [Phycisphaerae bacterium]